MTNQSPRLRIKLGEPIGNEIFFAFPEIQGNEKTFLESDSISGATSISANGLNFSTGQYIIVGNAGSEKTEIARIHQLTTPTATTITLDSGLSFAHNRGDLVQFIPYNQITPERSTDSGATFTPLTAINIRPDSTETYLQRTSDSSTDVYRFRFSNSADSTYSAYSDNATASGYADNTVYRIKRRSLLDMGEKYSELITNEFLNNALDEARRIVDNDTRILRWSFRTNFNSDIGSIIPGAWSITAPSDLRDRNTFKNILALRIGRQGRPLEYQPRDRFNQNYVNIAHSTLNGAITTGSTSIVLTSSGDFSDSGALYIGAESVLLTNDDVSYTANNVSTNTLSGVTGIHSGGHASGRDVWQNANFGLPNAYTIDNGVIYFDTPFADEFAGENIYMDYYLAITAVNSDSDTLDEPFYDFYVNYLKYKIKSLKANGMVDPKSDPDYALFMNGINQLISQETSGQVIQFIPTTGGFTGYGSYLGY